MDQSLLYLWAIRWSRLLPLILSILVLLLFALQKDRYTETGTAFDAHKWTLYDALICISILTFSFLLYAITKLELRAGYLLALGISLFVNYLSFFAVFRLKLKQKIAVLGISKKSFFKDVVFGLSIISPYLFVFFLLEYMISRLGSLPVYSSITYRGWSAYQGSPLVIVLVLYFVLFGPVFKELIFRGLLYSPLRRKIGPWPAIILTSILFTLLQGTFGFIFWISVILAYIYEKRRSLTSSIAAHIFSSIIHVAIYFYITDFFALGYKVDNASFFGILSLLLLMVFLITRLLRRSEEKALSA